MPLVCYERPNRTTRRVWTAKKVGQVCEYALREGSTPSELKEELEDCLGIGEQCDCALIRDLIGGLLAVLASIFIIVGGRQGPILLALLRLLRRLVRRIPALAGLLAYLERQQRQLELLREVERIARRIAELVRLP